MYAQLNIGIHSAVLRSSVCRIGEARQAQGWRKALLLRTKGQVRRKTGKILVASGFSNPTECQCLGSGMCVRDTPEEG